MKYPVLTHFRGPRARNHFAVALLAVADAAALDMVARPSLDHADRRLFLQQAVGCFRDIVYPMRRIDVDQREPCLTRDEFDAGWARMVATGYPAGIDGDAAWVRFADMRSVYAPVANQLLFWTVAAPAPWSGERHGFPEVRDQADAPMGWSIG